MFLEGSVYKPSFVLEKDIVLVTFNYRLGPIGKFRTSYCSGNNYGFKRRQQWCPRSKLLILQKCVLFFPHRVTSAMINTV